jgi:hypothetical protein
MADCIHLDYQMKQEERLNANGQLDLKHIIIIMLNI